MTQHIDPARFAITLKIEMECRRKPPAWMKVTRADDGLVEVHWGHDITDHDSLVLVEETIIASGGPDWVARLMLAKKRERVRMMEATG